MSKEINWERLRREAEEHYRQEAERRRKIGEEAMEDAERLARKAEATRERGVDVVADQSVYVYNGKIMLAKLPPSSLFNPTETPKGMALRTQLLSPSRGHYVEGPSWEPGEWTFAGRGHPGE